MTDDELQRMVDSSPVHADLGLRIRAVEGGVVVDALPTERHLGDVEAAMLHGGVIATILDTAAAFALIEHTGSDWSTVDLRVDFLRPATVTPLQATAVPVQAGSRLGRASAEVTETATGRVVGRAVGTFVRN